VTRLLRLTNSGSKPVNITGVDSSSPAVTAIVEPLTPGKEYKITLQLKKGTPDGQLRGQLRVNTSLPDQAVLTIPFYGIIGSVEG